MEIEIRTLNGNRTRFTVNPGDEVEVLRKQIQEKIGFPPQSYRLLFGGKELNDGTLDFYRIQKDSSILLLLRLSRPSEPSAAPATPPVPVVPKVRPEVEKCWLLAYTEKWGRAKKYLDDGEVTLNELEERTNRNLFLFFSERDTKEAVQYIVEKRGKPTLSQIHEAIGLAICNDRRQTVDYLLTELTSIAELQSLEGAVQPLHWAAAFSRHTLIKSLLTQGAKIDFYATKPAAYIPASLGTPLMVCCAAARFSVDKSDEKTLDMLLDAGADPNVVDPVTGDTPMHLVCKNAIGNDIAIALIRAGADPNVKNQEGKTPKEYAYEKSPILRVFNMHKKGKIRAKKRKSPEGGQAEQEEPPAKRVHIGENSPIFHTVAAAEARLDEWAMPLREDEEDDDTGKGRQDKGKYPVKDAINTDLLEIIAAGDNPLTPAAKIASSIAKALDGIVLGSDTDCKWIPFIVDVPVTKKKLSVMLAVRQSIRAVKSKMSGTKVPSMATPYFGQDEDRDVPEGVTQALAILRKETTDFHDLSFPEDHISYPVFFCGRVPFDKARYAVAGVYAVRVDT